MSAKKFFFLMLLIFFVSIGAAVGAIYYGDNFLSNKSLELAKLKAERDAQADVIQKIKSATGNQAELERLNDLADDVLPNEKRQAELVADILYTASTEAGIPTNNIKSISFAGSASPDSLSGATKSKTIATVYEYPFTIQINGVPYQQLLKFFIEIEKNKRIITVDNLQLTPSTLDPNVLDTVSLSLKTYFEP